MTCVQVALVVGESREEKKKISSPEGDSSCTPVVTVVNPYTTSPGQPGQPLWLLVLFVCFHAERVSSQLLLFGVQRAETRCAQLEHPDLDRSTLPPSWWGSCTWQPLQTQVIRWDPRWDHSGVPWAMPSSIPHALLSCFRGPTFP